MPRLVRTLFTSATLRRDYLGLGDWILCGRLAQT